MSYAPQIRTPQIVETVVCGVGRGLHGSLRRALDQGSRKRCRTWHVKSSTIRLDPLICRGPFVLRFDREKPQCGPDGAALVRTGPAEENCDSLHENRYPDRRKNCSDNSIQPQRPRRILVVGPSRETGKTPRWNTLQPCRRSDRQAAVPGSHPSVVGRKGKAETHEECAERQNARCGSHMHEQHPA